MYCSRLSVIYALQKPGCDFCTCRRIETSHHDTARHGGMSSIVVGYIPKYVYLFHRGGFSGTSNGDEEVTYECETSCIFLKLES